MGIFEVHDLSFAYAEQRSYMLREAPFSIPTGSVLHLLRTLRVREKHPPPADQAGAGPHG